MNRSLIGLQSQEDTECPLWSPHKLEHLVKVSVAQSCPTLWPWTVGCQAPLSMGILQARTLTCVVIAFSRGSSWPRDWRQVSCIAGRSFTVWATRESEVAQSCPALGQPPYTVAYQAPLPMGFSRQNWSGVPFPPPGDLPDPGIEPRSLALQADTSPSKPPGKPFQYAQGLGGDTGTCGMAKWECCDMPALWVLWKWLLSAPRHGLD